MTHLDLPLAAGIFTAGGAGALLRVLVVARAEALLGLGAPWSTLAVNIAGSALLGLLVGALPSPESTRLRLLLGGGLLGGFTTFSAFAVDTARLAGPSPGPATALALGSVLGTVLAAAAGLTLGRALRGG
jgi:CrcB protein